MNNENILYTKQYGYVCKDMNRSFGLLTNKLGILVRPFRGWRIDYIPSLINCCVIIHNIKAEFQRPRFLFNDIRGGFDEEINNNANDDVSGDDRLESMFG